ncbi:MAG: class I SAM-dependent methyltransferase [Elusimicrobia bacterium]|nr:class I SAM-dependent methyltransferase [Elusimicrobiota bacterium]
MNWRLKALAMRLCDALPLGPSLYEALQRGFGRLDADPIPQFLRTVEMARWMRARGLAIEGRSFLECGTGHKPTMPVGFFIMGARAVLTVDAHPRLNWELTRRALGRIVQNRESLEPLCASAADPAMVKDRMDLLSRLWGQPPAFLQEAGIEYAAPVDAARLSAPDKSLDYHVSLSVLEHISPAALRSLFFEARRVLAEGGAAIHCIDPTDHFQHTDKSISKINFLRFEEAEWARLAGNQFAYCNRMRASDYLRLFDELSFQVIEARTEVDEQAREVLASGFPLSGGFRAYAPEDLCTSSLSVMLRPR